MRSIIFLSKTGCLLPLLIFFNLFFGWMFLKPAIWIGAEVILIALFVINAIIITKKVFSTVSRGASGAIDIEGEVVEEDRLNLP